MSEQRGQDGQTEPHGCGCGGHGRAAREEAAREERAAAPAVVQPFAEGAPADVIPGRKAGNLLGLRDVSAPAPSQGGGCGCGGHGGGHRRCGCGSH